MLMRGDDRADAPPVAVISMGYSQRRFGGPANAIDQPILINNVAFTVVGVAPPEFFGVDPAEAPHVYLPLHAGLLLDPRDFTQKFPDPNYYWLQMMGRLRPGVTLAQAQAALAGPFAQWVTATAINDRERANLPVAAARGRRGRTRQPPPPVFEAALRAAGDGGPDPRDRLREHGEPAPRAGQPRATARWPSASVSAPDASGWCVSC